MSVDATVIASGVHGNGHRDLSKGRTAVGPAAVRIDDIVAAYKSTKQAARWPIPLALESAAEVAYRNDFVTELVKRSVPDILEAYVYFSVSDMKRLLGLARKYLLSSDLEGVGMDLGSGSGLLASVVASGQKVKTVLAIEVCEKATNLLIPKVASWVLHERSDKVIPVTGCFDDLQLPDNSIDFAVEIDSFHHADDLAAVMSECARVLKPGGLVLAFDRCWPNWVPDWDLEGLLSKVYTKEFLIANGYPPHITLTRRENGEHEYKLFQWQAGWQAAGLELERMCKFSQELTYRQAIKGLLSVLPSQIGKRLHSSDNAKLKTARLWAAQRLRTIARTVRWGKKIALPQYWPQKFVFAPRETTCFLLRKPL